MQYSSCEGGKRLFGIMFCLTSAVDVVMLSTFDEFVLVSLVFLGRQKRIKEKEADFCLALKLNAFQPKSLARWKCKTYCIWLVMIVDLVTMYELKLHGGSA